MKNARLETLLSFYEEDPHDPFNIYALALEYQKSDLSLAKAHFSKLLAEHPGYLATYYHAAEFFAQLGDIEMADEIYVRGIGLALDQNNVKTHQELVRAYRNFQDEQED